MNNVYIGTCSWTDKSLLRSNEFYPREVKSSEQRLRYYASFFDTVEVDSSFYALPSEKNSRLWVERTPPDFLFNFKAFCLMTGHSVNLKSLPEDLRNHLDSNNKDRIFIKDNVIISEIFVRFKNAILPVFRAKKMGLVIFQYPPWFEKSLRNMDTILKTKEMMGEMDCGIEFRNRSWLENKKDETLDFLRKNNLIYVISDAPQVKTAQTTRYFVDVTADTAYFRFHGRNVENWQRKGIDASLRYDYEYSKSELLSFKNDIKFIKMKVNRVFAMFNNHRGKQAIKNALELKNLLKE